MNTGMVQKTALKNDSRMENKNTEKTSKSSANPSDEPRRIDCGLKSVDPVLYRRDYYVNSNGKNSLKSGTETSSSTRSDGSSSNVSDDGNYSCSGGSSSPEDQSSSYLSSPELSRNSSVVNKNIMEPFNRKNLVNVFQ